MDLLSGGQTTGIIKDIGTTGPWTQEKLKGYRAHPLSLEDSDGHKANKPKK